MKISFKNVKQLLEIVKLHYTTFMNAKFYDFCTLQYF